jgi:hypothetical protein
MTEWGYSLELAAGLDSGPRLVSKHWVIRELPDGEMERRGPFVSQVAAENVAKALNIAIRMEGLIG